MSLAAQDLFEVIYEDPELLVLNKPAGLVCHPTKTDAYSSLISRTRLYLGPESRPQLINRLDRETSGVTVVAKSEPAARELRRLWEQRQVYKGYLAIVHGSVSAEEGKMDLPLGKDENSRVAIKDCVRSDGAAAQTRYVALKRFSRSTEAGPLPFSLLEVSPQTGRKHQIRIHLAHAGHPIVGDKLYGPDEDIYLALVENRLTAAQKQRLILPFHALHASVVRFAWRGQLREYGAPPEPWFSEFYSVAE